MFLASPHLQKHSCPPCARGTDGRGEAVSLRCSELVLHAVGGSGFWELFCLICKLLNQLRNGCPRFLGLCVFRNQIRQSFWS